MLVRIVTCKGLAARHIAATVRVRLIVLVVAYLGRGERVRVNCASDVSSASFGARIEW